MQHVNVSEQVKSKLSSCRRKMGFQSYNDVLKWLLEEHEIDETKKNVSANTALVKARVQTAECGNALTSPKNQKRKTCFHPTIDEWIGEV